MKLNVATELKLPGREGHAVLCERIEDIEYPGRWIRFADDVTVEINYVFDGSGFETSGSVKTALKGECARCAKELTVPFAHEFEERFEKNAPEDGDAIGVQVVDIAEDTPVWRRVETLARTVSVPRSRTVSDARSQAQGAAEKIAKLNCPSGVEILDKWVDYSMIDDEFVYATVVLVFEAPIGARHDTD